MSGKTTDNMMAIGSRTKCADSASLNGLTEDIIKVSSLMTNEKEKGKCTILTGLDTKEIGGKENRMDMDKYLKVLS